MKLEQFRVIADENLQELIADERMLQRVHQQMCAVKTARRPAIPRRAMALAAACVVVMMISGGVLIGTMGVGRKDPVQQFSVATVQAKQPVNSASTLSAHAETSQYVDGTVLPYGIAQIGEYCEGAAPARASNGLYGIVDEDGVWIVKAMYDDVMKMENGKAVVMQQGVEQIIEIPAK